MLLCLGMAFSKLTLDFFFGLLTSLVEGSLKWMEKLLQPKSLGSHSVCPRGGSARGWGATASLGGLWSLLSCILPCEFFKTFQRRLLVMVLIDRCAFGLPFYTESTQTLLNWHQESGRCWLRCCSGRLLDALQNWTVNLNCLRLLWLLVRVFL